MTNQNSLTVVDQSEAEVVFSLAGALRGARRVLPVALSVCAYGLTFGVLARQAGLSVLEVFLMSGLVYAGSAQLIVLSLWTMPLPIGMIALTTLIVNVRNVLLGAALSPWLLRLSALKVYTTCFFLSDENWALTLGEFERGEHDGAFLLGSGLVMYLAWVSSTVLGRTLGTIIQDPAQWGLDFAFSAVFLALLVPLWRGKVDLLPWLMAVVVAVVSARFVPGKWYILLGALAGSITGAILGGARHAK
jgi:4-azaleucine resistance transporter AzlC